MSEPVLVTYGGFAIDHPDCGGALREAGYEPHSHPREADRGPDELVELIGTAPAVIADADPFTAAVFERAPNLRVVARTGVGLDSIDLAAASAAGVVVTVTPGTNDETVADHALALILAALRQLGRQDAQVRSGGWRSFEIPARQLHGSTVGLVGYGAIGRATGRRLLGFGAEVLAHDPFVESAEVELVSIEELCARSDVISIHSPLTAETTHLIDAARIATMVPGVVIVNTARGPIVDQEALLAGLRDGHVGAAGLDVFEVEPPGESGLGESANVVLSPHVGGISDVSNLAMSRLATRSVLGVLAGETPDHVVNP